jgi:hypothetical protein
MTLLARVFPVLVLGSVASAEPATDLPALPGDLPAQCQPLAEIPASARTPGPGTAAHISVANCVAEVAMNQLTVRPDIDSLAELGAAVAASMDMLDDVIRLGDPYWNVIAQNAKHDLYVGMIVRTRVSLDGDVSAHEELEAELAPWRDDASRAIDAIAAIAVEDPTLAKRDAVIADIVRQLPEQRHVSRTANFSRMR